MAKTVIDSDDELLFEASAVLGTQPSRQDRPGPDTGVNVAAS